MICLPITESGGVGPWQISPAGNEHSARIQKRIEEARAAREKQARLAAEQAKLEARRERRRKKRKENALPLWKQRAQERAAGLSGTHKDRRPRGGNGSN